MTEVYCISDCGCAGGQVDRECDFMPDCPRCRPFQVHLVDCPEYPAKCDLRQVYPSELAAHLQDIADTRALWIKQMEEDPA
jgi:hypothetical protein